MLKLISSIPLVSPATAILRKHTLPAPLYSHFTCSAGKRYSGEQIITAPPQIEKACWLLTDFTKEARNRKHYEHALTGKQFSRVDSVNKSFKQKIFTPKVGLMAKSFTWSIGATASNFIGYRSYSNCSHNFIANLLVNNVSGFPLRLQALREELLGFMESEVFPNEKVLHDHQSSPDRWKPHPLVNELKAKAKSIGLWNLFLPIEVDPKRQYGAGLTNLEYAHLAEIMGQSFYAHEIFNCSQPDTGNMRLLTRWGTDKQKVRWLTPLLNGEIRSCYAFSEPDVASSDATNIQSSIVADGDHYVLNGRKWWVTGGMNTRCKVCIFMGKTDPQAPKHKQQSIVLVPMDTPGVRVLRPLTAFGYDHAHFGYAEMIFEDVRVPRENILLGEGRGFEIAQGMLDPGGLQLSMRIIGMAERALLIMKQRIQNRRAFGKTLSQFDIILSDIAQSRIEIEQARLLTLKAAHMMDTVGRHVSSAMIKAVAPRVVQDVIDRAIQAHGALGFSDDVPLAQFFVVSRIIRITNGSDELHRAFIGKLELKEQ